MGLSTKLMMGGLAAGAALAYYVRRRHEMSGESYLEILKQLPATARHTVTDVRRRATLALEEGKAASRARENEFVAQLSAAEPSRNRDFSTFPGP